MGKALKVNRGGGDSKASGKTFFTCALSGSDIIIPASKILAGHRYSIWIPAITGSYKGYFSCLFWKKADGTLGYFTSNYCFAWVDASGNTTYGNSGGGSGPTTSGSNYLLTVNNLSTCAVSGDNVVTVIDVE